MSETSFPIDDLIRRKLQTFLIVVTLALSVGSTFFLLSFAEKIGLNVSLIVEGRLTAGFSSILSPFILFLAVLMLLAGGVMVSFMVSLMMSQRIRDIGVMKAAGCPNELVFGYFFTELLILVFTGCLGGVAAGVVADFAFSSLFGSLTQLSQARINLLLLISVFVLFFVLSLVVGTRPVLRAAKMKPTMALSPSSYIGLTKESRSRVLARRGFTFKLALRSLVRRRSSTVRIVLSLSTVFTLVTAAVAGGLIARQTTGSWVERAIGRDTFLVAHQEVCNAYRGLLESFFAGGADPSLNYTDDAYLLNDSFFDQLSSLDGVGGVEARMLTRAVVREVQGFVLGETSSQTRVIGDSRSAEALIVGVQPADVLNSGFIRGDPLRSGEAHEAVVGDTLSATIFSDALLQKIQVFNGTFDVTGVCIDPINNGKVVYIPMETLQNLTGQGRPNVALVKAESSVDRKQFVNAITEIAHSQGADFAVLDLEDVLNKDLDFMSYIWSLVQVLPLLSLVTASLCLIGFVALSIDEQRQEFGILRAIGARPRMVVEIVSWQSLLVLLSSYGTGVAFGTIFTLLILVQEPVVSVLTVLQIASWLTVALIGIFLASLCPAVRFARKPLLEAIR